MTRLTKEQIARRQELTRKLRDKTITREEAGELKKILQIEREEAKNIGDFVALLAVFFLLGAVIAFLSAKD